ncbi:hypothetical protein NDU88_001065 [Pleurodeles waltl]|uniref:Uncharacterized protein n=1 Tax=Pleurodeles waltl TaxID=8319 RepID=A0AAV7V7F9_PLEWA|nr:hypothetical protein NDU88_001065 [Pleurodeles waltl]
MVSLNNNMCGIKDDIKQLITTVEEGKKANADIFNELTTVIKELCTVMQQDHVTHRSQKLGIEELIEEQDAPNRKDTPPGLENTNGRRQGEYDCGAEDTRIFEEVDRRSDLR